MKCELSLLKYYICQDRDICKCKGTKFKYQSKKSPHWSLTFLIQLHCFKMLLNILPSSVNGVFDPFIVLEVITNNTQFGAFLQLTMITVVFSLSYF